jgi:hypothetical protein
MNAPTTNRPHHEVCRYECGTRRVVCSVCKTIVGPAHNLKNGACHYFKCQAAVAAKES